MTESGTLPGLDLPAAQFFLENSNPGMGEYSGDLLKARKPELYRAAVQLLGRGYGIRDTAVILGVSARSVMAIRDREPAAIATVKESTARRYLDVSQLAAEIARERLLECPDTVSFKDLMIGGAVATDKHLVLSGEATQRVEHVVRPASDDFDRMLADARRRGQYLEGEIVPDTGIDGGLAGTNGAPAAGDAVRVAPADGASAGVDRVVDHVPVDTESSVTGVKAPPIVGSCVPVTGNGTGAPAGGGVAAPVPERIRPASAGSAASIDTDCGPGGEGVGAATQPKTSNESDLGEISRKGQS